MRRKHVLGTVAFLGILFALLLLVPAGVLAHCDTMDGPVVQAAQKALATGNVKLVLIWVQKTMRRRSIRLSRGPWPSGN